MYNIILAFLEALLEPCSLFWQNTIRNKNNKFYSYFSCIAIDKV